MEFVQISKITIENNKEIKACCTCGCGCECEPESVEQSVRKPGTKGGAGATAGASPTSGLN